jgi:hypothetical protein
MNFSTPLCLLTKKTRLSLLKLLNSAISSAWQHKHESTIASSRKAPRVRALSTIARALSLCPLSASLSAAFSHLSVSPHSDNLHRVLEDVADRYITFVLGSPPPLDQAGIRVSTWNVTSLSPLSGGYKNKLVSNLAGERIVCLQETKMSIEDARLLQLQISGCLVISTPCLYEEAGSGLGCSQNSREEASSSHTQAPSMSIADHSQRNATGGVAVLLPTYLCSTQVSTHELIPGYAVAATFATRTFAW